MWGRDEVHAGVGGGEGGEIWGWRRKQKPEREEGLKMVCKIFFLNQWTCVDRCGPREYGWVWRRAALDKRTHWNDSSSVNFKLTKYRVTKAGRGIDKSTSPALISSGDTALFSSDALPTFKNSSELEWKGSTCGLQTSPNSRKVSQAEILAALET